MLAVIGETGGVTEVPDFVDDSTFRTLGEFALVWIRAMEEAQVCSRGLWIPLLSVPDRRITFAPKDWVQMAAEKLVVDSGFAYVGMPS